MVDDRRGRDQRVFQQVVRSPVHELGPGPECAPIERQYIPGLRNLINPRLDLGGLLWVLLAAHFDAGLELAESNRREMEIFIGDALKPRYHGAVGLRPPEL